jgi:hypothetical protein
MVEDEHKAGSRARMVDELLARVTSPPSSRIFPFVESMIRFREDVRMTITVVRSQELQLRDTRISGTSRQSAARFLKSINVFV